GLIADWGRGRCCYGIGRSRRWLPDRASACDVCRVISPPRDRYLAASNRDEKRRCTWWTPLCCKYQLAIDSGFYGIGHCRFAAWGTSCCQNTSQHIANRIRLVRPSHGNLRYRKRTYPFTHLSWQSVTEQRNIAVPHLTRY